MSHLYDYLSRYWVVVATAFHLSIYDTKLFVLLLAALIGTTTAVVLELTTNVTKMPIRFSGIGFGVAFCLATVALLVSPERARRGPEPAGHVGDGPVSPRDLERQSEQAFERVLRENPDFKRFLWPMPRASAIAFLPNDLFGTEKISLADVGKSLEAALGRHGFRYSYFYVPLGFALVTDIEQIADDGSTLEGEQRYSKFPAIASAGFSVAEYFNLLVRAPVGKYRGIVFVVAGLPGSTIEMHFARDDYASLSRLGNHALPAFYYGVPFSHDYEVEAYIYVFQGRGDSQAWALDQSALTGEAHLEKAKLLKELQSARRLPLCPALSAEVFTRDTRMLACR